MWEEPLARPPLRHEPRDFRNALGTFPTGVCIVTALAPGGRPAGLTINSFSSVSLEPPMILWSLARSAAAADVFREAEYFAVNVLAAGDEALSTHFSRSKTFDAFPGRFSPGIDGAPLLQGAAAAFECHTRHRYYGGDHVILIGNVERYSWSDAAPLVFHRGRYVTAAAA